MFPMNSGLLPKRERLMHLILLKAYALAVALSYAYFAKSKCAGEQHVLPPSSTLLSRFPCDGSIIYRASFLLWHLPHAIADMIQLRYYWVRTCMALCLLRLPLAYLLPSKKYDTVGQILTYVSRVVPAAWHIFTFGKSVEPTAHSVWFFTCFNPFLELFLFVTTPVNASLFRLEALVGFGNLAAIALLAYEYGKRYPQCGMDLMTVLPRHVLSYAACLVMARSLSGRRRATTLTNHFAANNGSTQMKGMRCHSAQSSKAGTLCLSGEGGLDGLNKASMEGSPGSDCAKAANDNTPRTFSSTDAWDMRCDRDRHQPVHEQSQQEQSQEQQEHLGRLPELLVTSGTNASTIAVGGAVAAVTPGRDDNISAYTSSMAPVIPAGQSTLRTEAIASRSTPIPTALPYRPFIQHRILFTKIPGCEPTQIAPGYEQRLALLVAALEGRRLSAVDPGGVEGERRLGHVYVRAGCIELLMEEEEWGSGVGSASGDDDSADDCTRPCSSASLSRLFELEKEENLSSEGASRLVHTGTGITGFAGSFTVEFIEAELPEVGDGHGEAAATPALQGGAVTAMPIGANGPPSQQQGSGGRLTFVGIVDALQLPAPLTIRQPQPRPTEPSAGAVASSVQGSHVAAVGGCPLGLVSASPRVLLQAQHGSPGSHWQNPSGAEGPHDSDEGAQTTLLVMMQCSALTPAAAAADMLAPDSTPPPELEVLVRARGAYLPATFTWLPERQSPCPVGTDPLNDLRDVLEGLGGSTAGYVVPVASRMLVAEVRLLVQPPPGLIVVDFRWLGRPCRAVPLVLTRDPAVAAELGAAVAAWPRSVAELDALLLDFGTWEFHAANAEVAAVVPHQAVPPTSSLPSRMAPALGRHLLSFALACGWQAVAEQLRRDLARLEGGVQRPMGHTDAPVAAGGGSGAGSSSGGDGSWGSGSPTSGSAMLDSGDVDAAAANIPSSSNAGAATQDGVRLPSGVSSGRAAWAEALLLTLGLRRVAPAEEEGFRSYAESWTFAQGHTIRVLEFLGLLSILCRCAYDRVLFTSTALSALLAIGVGAFSTAARAVLPYPAWAALERRCVLPRYTGYMAAKSLIAFAGVPAPPGVAPYLMSPGLLAFQGVILPVSCLLPTRLALLIIPALNIITSLELLVTSPAISPATAALIGGCTALAGLATTLACHVLMRMCFGRRRRGMGTAGVTTVANGQSGKGSKED